MSEPWFDANQWGWLPGTAMGVLCGLWGTLAGILVPRGKAKGLMWGAYWLFLAAGAVLLVAGIVAVTADQPYGVWFSLVLAGGLLLVVIGPLGAVLRKGYRQADERRMQAQDLG